MNIEQENQVSMPSLSKTQTMLWTCLFGSLFLFWGAFFSLYTTSYYAQGPYWATVVISFPIVLILGLFILEYRTQYSLALSALTILFTALGMFLGMFFLLQAQPFKENVQMYTTQQGALMTLVEAGQKNSDLYRQIASWTTFEQAKPHQALLEDLRSAMTGSSRLLPFKAIVLSLGSMGVDVPSSIKTHLFEQNLLYQSDEQRLNKVMGKAINNPQISSTQQQQLTLLLAQTKNN